MSEKIQRPPTNRGANMPLVQNTDKNTYPCVGFDWVEFTATINGDLPKMPFMFSHDINEKGTSHYKQLYTITTLVKGKEMPFCTMQVEPRVCFIDNNVVQIKIDNAFLYNPDLLRDIKHFLREYGLNFKNYLRLDLFIDFQDVNYYDTPNDVLKLFKSEQIRIKGKKVKTISRYGRVETVTFGSRSSTCMMSMYNKTLEMGVKTFKPWVYQLWVNAGFNISKETYRLEFSLKKPKTYIVNEDGLFICNYSDIDTLNQFDAILDYAYNTHFNPVYFEQDVRHSRCHKYNMFNFTGTPYKSQIIVQAPKSNNYTKSYIKRLCIDAMFLDKKGQNVECSYLLDHINMLVERHMLQKWFADKIWWLNCEKSKLTIFDMIHGTIAKDLQLKQATLFKIPQFHKPLKRNQKPAKKRKFNNRFKETEKI